MQIRQQYHRLTCAGKSGNETIFIIQPCGSKKDDEVIAAADKYGIAMVFTGNTNSS